MYLVIILAVLGIGGLLFLNEQAQAKASSTAINANTGATAPPPVVINAPPTPTVGQTALTQVAPAVTQVTSQIPVVGPALAAVENIILGQHTARLNDAIAENKVIPSVVQAFDADLQVIVQGYNSGEATAAQCIAALILMDQQIYAAMRNNAQAKPGIAWNTNPAYSPSTDALVGSTAINPSYGAPCDKTCTVSCCVYYNDLRPAIYGRNVIGPGNPSSKAPYAQYQNPPGSGLIMGAIQALRNGSGLVHVIAIAPPDDPAYGNYTRAAYDVTFVKPSAVPTSLAHLA